MEKTTKSYERLQQVIEWAGMSTHSFAIHIGMTRSENIYRIIRNQENVSIRVVMLILGAFPQISRNWLTCGVGDMLCDKPLESVDIPLHEYLHENALSLSVFLVNKGIDLALFASDDAMLPIISHGSILLMEKQNIDKIIFGKIYYVESPDWSLVRAIRRCEVTDDEIVLVPTNKQDYDNMTVNKSKITCIYKISRVINNLK